ncbi:MAG: SGNH/GDSL hydrolase family protein [Colwellia sp.]|nr:SGNH/GDSL hydrolase family protein [Colwellia sp.]
MSRTRVSTLKYHEAIIEVISKANTILLLRHYSVNYAFIVNAGLWIRLTTLQLPEENGERSGYCCDGIKLNLLIIGDSAAAGVGVDEQSEALASLLAVKLAVNHTVNWCLIANTGYTSIDVINELTALPAQSFDYVLVSVGVNDVTHLTRSNHWVTNLSTIVELLNAKFSAPKVFLASVPPMHLFTAIPNPLRWWLGLRAKRLNELMTSAVKSNSHCSVLSFDLPFQPEFLAEDGINPSNLAYQAWANKAVDAIGYQQ